jgi:hypothetical protein
LLWVSIAGIVIAILGVYDLILGVYDLYEYATGSNSSLVDELIPSWFRWVYVFYGPLNLAVFALILIRGKHSPYSVANDLKWINLIAGAIGTLIMAALLIGLSLAA